jgi:small-conductance mechanosensitive channel
MWYKIAVPIVSAIVVNWLAQRFVRVPKNLDSPRTQTYFSMAKSVISLTVYVLAGYYIFSYLNINVTPLFASAGVIGLVIGLGMRSFFEDLFTGLLILTQDTISVGDYVKIGDTEGITEALGLRTVRVRDSSGAIHIYPNREIKKIVNYSRRQARVVITISVQPNQPVDAVFKALKRALVKLRKDKKIGASIQANSQILGVEDIGRGHVDISVLILTKASLRWATARRFRYLALNELNRAKILMA